MFTYRGNCHCGRFVYEVESLKEITEVGVCNCSICYKKGYVHCPIRNDGDVKFNVVKGSIDELATYAFNGKTRSHKFCPDCGSAVMITNKDVYTINVRCFQKCDDVDFLPSLKKIPFNGKALEPPYVEPEYTGPEPTGGPQGDAPAKIYHGSCHCGAVRMSLRTRPLEDVKAEEGPRSDDRIIDCHCSICTRGAYVWTYPHKDQVAVEGMENLQFYNFGHYANSKTFCRTCGVHMFNLSRVFTPEEEAALPELARTDKARSWRQRMADRWPTTIRVLHGVDVDALDAVKVDGFKVLNPQYVNP